MNAFKRNSWLAAAIGAIALSATGCGDPWKDEAGGTPQIQRVIASVGTNTGSAPLADVTQATNGTYQVAAAAADEPMVVIVQFNKQLAGESIEQTPNSCVPVSATFTPAVAGATLMSCYYPSSAAPGIGASIVYFLADSTAVADGIDAAVPLQSGTITATVKDKSGTEIPISVALTIQ